MSRSPLPPRSDGPPPKVVIAGVEPGSPEEAAIAARYAGAIKSFHFKARQTQQLSEQPISRLHQTLPGGGRMRYTFHNGQEMIQVNVPTPTSSQDVRRERKTPILPAPYLAVDVLFDNKRHLVHDVYSVLELGDDRDIGNLDDWNFIDLVNWDDVISYYARFPRWDVILGEVTIVEGEKLNEAGQVAPQTHGWVVGWGSWLRCDPGSAPRIDPYRKTELTEVTIVDGSGDPPQIWISGYYEFYPPRPRRYARVAYYFYDNMNVVALRIPSETQEITAWSDGHSDKPEVLKALNGASAEQDITRMPDIESDLETTNITGAGFLVKPVISMVETPSEVIVNAPGINIEVYVASLNMTRENGYPPNPGDGSSDDLLVDTPDLTYSLEGRIEATIRAREFLGSEPKVIGVALSDTRKWEQYHSPAGATTVEPPTELVYEAVQESGRSISFSFAALPTWKDPGEGIADFSSQPEPALPTAVDDEGKPTMGDLLAEKTISATVTGISTSERRIPFELVWGGEITDMSKIATITWFPSGNLQRPGTAKIEPA